MKQPLKFFYHHDESFTWVIALSILILLLRPLLWGHSTLIHDNFYWNYPVFQFFLESILNGHYPLWDPFMHGGEPFYPLISHFRLFEPLALLTIYIGQIFTQDGILIFNWYRFVQNLFVAFGIYLVFRPWARTLFIRLSLIPILLFSSMMLVDLRQDGMINQFLWIPFMTYFLLKIIYSQDSSWRHWLILSGIIGMNWQSMFFTGTWIYLLFFALGLLLFNRNLIVLLLKQKQLFLKILVMAVINIFMLLPNVVLLLEKKEFVFPARMLNTEYKNGQSLYAPQQYEGNPEDIVEGIIMPYVLVSKTGTYSTLWDFIQTLAPEGNSYLHWYGEIPWGNASEALIYIGFIPWVLCLLGIIYGQHPLKKFWLFIVILFGLLILGPAGGLHQFLFYLYPPLWFIRHTHCLVFFFSFILFYFYILGGNYVVDLWQTNLFDIRKLLYRVVKPRFLLFVLILLIQVICIFYFSTNRSRFILKFILSIIVPLFTAIFLKETLFKKYYWDKKITFMFFMALSISVDLIHFFYKSEFLYTHQKHPTLEFGINTKISQTEKLKNRSLLPPEIHPDQSMRYSSLISKIPTVLSPIMDDIDAKKYVPTSRLRMTQKDLLPNSFDYGYKNFRWNSMFLLKNYFYLLHSDIPASALNEIFAVNKPNIQFKKGALPLENREVIKSLIHLGPEKSTQFLKDYIFIDPEDKTNLNINTGVIENYKNFIQDTSGSAPFSKINIINDNYNSLNISVNLNKAGILYYSDGYDKRWKATIDGKETPVYRANINFKAVEVPAGAHTVQWIYRPTYFKRSLILFYGSFTISLLGYFFLSIRKRYLIGLNDKIIIGHHEK